MKAKMENVVTKEAFAEATGKLLTRNEFLIWLGIAVTIIIAIK